MAEYSAQYEIATDNIDAIRYQAREEIAMKKMLDKEFVLIDSAVMQDNKTNFIVESGNIADYYSISIEDVKYPINFFSENKDMSITGDVKDNRNISVTGSNAQELIKEYNNENKKFYNQLRELGQQYREVAQGGNQAELERIENEYKSNTYGYKT